VDLDVKCEERYGFVFGTEGQAFMC